MKNLMPVMFAAVFLVASTMAIAAPMRSDLPPLPGTASKVFCPFGTVPTQVPNPDYPGNQAKEFPPPAIPPYITVCVPIVKPT